MSCAAVAGLPSPLKMAVPVPATVVIVPPALTLRMRWLLVSAMKRLPEPSTATPWGPLSCAADAGPLSPPKPWPLVPATVVIVPSASTLRMRWLLVSAMKRLPEPSTATPCGSVELCRGCRPGVPAEAVGPRARHRGDRPAGADLADTVVAGIGDVEVPEAVYRRAMGEAEPRSGCRTAIPSEAMAPRARRCGDRASGIDLEDAVIAGISDIEVAGAVVHHHVNGEVELCLGCPPADSPGPLGLRARRRGDRPAGVDLADTVVAGIGEVEVPGAVQPHADGIVELRRGCRPAVPAGALSPRARYRGDRPAGIDFADALVAGIGDVEVARAVQRRASGEVELRRGCRPAVPAEAGGPRSRHRGDRPIGIDPADALVAGIGDVEVSRAVQRYVAGSVELRRGCRPAVPAEAGGPRSRHRGDRPEGIDPENAVSGII